MKVGMLTMTGTDGTRSVLLSQRCTSIGRSSQCGVQLDDHSVSRHHADLERRADGYLLKDCDSRNGTSVNGVAVVYRLLMDNDRVSFGNIEWVFHEVEEESAENSKDELIPPPRYNEDGMTEATTSHPINNILADGRWDVLQSWQVVQRFGEIEGRDVGAVLLVLAQGLAGLRDIKKSLVYVEPAILSGSAKWFSAGEKGGSSRAFAEEKLLEVARSGEPLSLHAGKYLSGLHDGESEAVCLPIRISARPCACLYLEGMNGLSEAAISAARATARGISVGLTIWMNACREKNAALVTRHNPVIVGRSKGIQQVFRMAEKSAATDATVLIRGETGTGKELFARLIYSESNRKNSSFVPVHCSAIEETLMGSVLFGHEKGAFTGAVGQKKGVFEEAHEGTIFLDEIGELSPAMQVKLLRVLQEGEFMRVGGSKPIRVNVRVIAATNRDLEDAIQKGLFRQDLFYRLNVLTIQIPPLRERREDIADMVRHYLAEIGSQIAKSAEAIQPEAQAILEKYDWPGNVRELRNVIERCLVLADGPTITVDDLPPEVVLTGEACQQTGDNGSAGNLDDIETQHIRKVLAECGGNKRLTAQRLGISRSTLYEKLRQPIS